MVCKCILKRYNNNYVNFNGEFGTVVIQQLHCIVRTNDASEDYEKTPLVYCLSHGLVASVFKLEINFFPWCPLSKYNESPREKILLIVQYERQYLAWFLQQYTDFVLEELSFCLKSGLLKIPKLTSNVSFVFRCAWCWSTHPISTGTNAV